MVGGNSAKHGGGWAAPALVGAAALAGTALAVGLASRRAEREHPPMGRFVEVDGVRLHYVDRGHGRPVVLLHGNMMLIEDWALSGVLDWRPAATACSPSTAPATAAASARATGSGPRRRRPTCCTRRCGGSASSGPIVVGHSFGTLVALELALRHPEAVAGLVLLRLLLPDDAGGRAGPVTAGDPGGGRCPAPHRLAADPAPVLAGPHARPVRPGPDAAGLQPAEGLMSRPEPIRASASESALLVPSAAGLQPIRELSLPVAILAGADDRFVDTGRQSGELHRMLPRSCFRTVPGAGHMVHHTAPEAALAAVDAAQP